MIHAFMQVFRYILSFIDGLFESLKRWLHLSPSNSVLQSGGLSEDENLTQQNAEKILEPASPISEPIISIDLGAAYTKVSYRAGIQPGEAFQEVSKTLILDGRPLIPSLVIQEKNGAKFFGRLAAGLNPSGRQVHENWKKSLLDSANLTDSSIKVTALFFSWLRERLESLVPDLPHTRIRIALPAFELFDAKALLLKNCMAKAGWDPKRIEVVREPHVNIVGLTSKGRNIVVWPKPGNTPSLNYALMFNQFGLIERARNDFVNSARASQFLKGLVLDLGAYTTDVAPLIINLAGDLSDYGRGFTATKHTSLRLGIMDQLDKPIFDYLRILTSFDRSQVSLETFELIKETLYRRESYYDRSGSGEIQLGTEEHHRILDGHFQNFVDNLWSQVVPIATPHNPEWIILTGGGSQISRLTNLIRQKVEAAGLRIAFADTETGRAPEPKPDDYSDWIIWSEENLQLKRLATALGGVSVLLDVFDHNSSDSQPDLETAQTGDRPRRDLEVVQCICGGMNPNCEYCSGTGYVRNR